MTIDCKIEAGKYIGKKSGKPYYGAFLICKNGFRKFVTFDINEIARILDTSVAEFVKEVEKL